jgi:hypothetical protein
MQALVDTVIRAHGGAERWRQVDAILSRVSMGGFEFASRFYPSPMEQVEVRVAVAEPNIVFSHWPFPGYEARFTPTRVYVLDDRGRLFEERRGPGAVFRSPRHWLLWDRLDVLFYAGVCVWQAMCGPFLLLRSGCRIEELSPWSYAGEQWRRLEISLPADVPNLSPRQTLYIDNSGQLRRVDASPQVYGTLLRVGQHLSELTVCDGVVLARRRRVYPVLPTGALLRATRLAWMDLDDVSMVFRQRTAVVE